MQAFSNIDYSKKINAKYRWLLIVCICSYLLILPSGIGYSHELNSHVIAPGVVHVHELSIAVGCAEPPYYGFDGFQGKEWDSVSKALSHAGHKGRLYFIGLQEGLFALEKGLIDGVWICDRKNAPSNGFYISEPLLPRTISAITLSDSNLQINSLKDLANKRVAYHPSLSSPLGAELQEIISINPLVQSISNHELLAIYLFSGRIDVLISERNVFEYHKQRISSRIDTKQPVIFHNIFPTYYPRIVFRDEVLRDEFNIAWHEIMGREKLVPVTSGESPISDPSSDALNGKNTQ